MTWDPAQAWWRLERRFAMADDVRSDLARRVFPLFVTDWRLHQPATVEPVSLGAYARQLQRTPTNVSVAFDRLVGAGWLVEHARVGPPSKAQRTFSPGPAWLRVTHPERRSA